MVLNIIAVIAAAIVTLNGGATRYLYLRFKNKSQEKQILRKLYFFIYLSLHLVNAVFSLSQCSIDKMKRERG